MSPCNALLIPPRGDPAVLSHEHWTYDAVESAIGTRQCLTCALPLRVRSRHWLLMLAGAEPREPNASAERLGGAAARAMSGPLLVLSMSDHSGKVADLSERELLAISTHLLVGELRHTLTASSDPHRIARSAGRATPSIPGGTA